MFIPTATRPCTCNPRDPGRCGAACYSCNGAKKKWQTWPKETYATCGICKGTGVNPSWRH